MFYDGDGWSQEMMGLDQSNAASGTHLNKHAQTCRATHPAWGLFHKQFKYSYLKKIHKILFDLILIINLSGHNFAHAMTAKLSWDV